MKAALATAPRSFPWRNGWHNKQGRTARQMNTGRIGNVAADCQRAISGVPAVRRDACTTNADCSRDGCTTKVLRADGGLELAFGVEARGFPRGVESLGSQADQLVTL